MTHGRQFGSGVIWWIKGVYRRLVRSVILLTITAAFLAGYAYSRDWLEVELHVTGSLEEAAMAADVPRSGTGLGVTGRGRAYGIFVTVSDFPGEDRNLPGHSGLARRVADAFIRARIMEREHAIILMDEQATPDAFREAVARQRLRLTREDLVIVYFATHGGENSLELYGGTSINESEIQTELAFLHAGQGLFIADACHSGSLDWAMPGRGEAGTLWHGLYSTGAASISYAEYFSNAIVELAPLLGRDDGDVTMEELLAGVQARTRSRLSSGMRLEMESNALGEGDAVLWRVSRPAVASRE
ncbi:C13 family peptidase [Patescibacteria group bacterium]|jgi:hypothetical protein|nr:C13 family peptidase [Patescibacteria group bacterium]